MIEISEEIYQKFLATAHEVGSSGLTLCSSGNLSMRINEDVAIVSGTGSWLPKLRKEQICIADIKTGQPLNEIRSSMESGFHLGVLRENPGVNVVLHCSPFYATTIAAMKNRPQNYNVIAEVPCYCVGIKEIAYTRPGSPELAKKVMEVLKDNDVALLLNHGIVVKGKDLDDAFQKATFFEFACRIIVQSKGDYEVLNQDAVDDLDYYVKGKEKKTMS